MYLPYKVQKNTDGTYYFLTESNTKYSIIFSDRTDLNVVKDLTVYEFAFAPESSDNDFTPPRDYRISSTILKVISDFFKKETNSLLFVCDSTDNKGMARNRLFNSWYEKSGIQHIEKHNETIPDPKNSDIITSLLIHANAPNKTKMISSYKDLSLYYSSFK